MADSKSTPGRRIIGCDHCDKSFGRYVSQIKDRNYCSRACKGLSWRSGCVLFCAWCDSEFYRAKGEQDIGVKARQFCSRECYAEWRAAKRRSYPRGYGGRHKHRLVAESLLGRALEPGEVVHHIDNNRQNYKPSNLAVFPSQSDHMRCHAGKMTDAELRRFSLA